MEEGTVEEEEEEPAPLASMESAGTGYPSLVVTDEPAGSAVAAAADDDWQAKEELWKHYWTDISRGTFTSAQEENVTRHPCRAVYQYRVFHHLADLD